MPVTTEISRRRSTRTMAAMLAVGTVSALALSACSSTGTAGAGGVANAKTPVEALAASVTNLSAQKAASFEVSLVPDSAMIAAMSKDATGKDATVIKALFSNGGLDVKVAVSADKALKDLKATDSPNADFQVSLGGKSYIEVREVAGALYAKIDVPDILTLAGTPSSVVTGQLGQLPAAVQGPAQAVLGGGWISVSAADLKSLTALASSLGGSTDLQPTVGAPNSAAAAQFASALVTALTKDTTVVDKGNGQLQVSGKTRAVAQDLLQAYQPLLSGVPSQLKSSFTKTQQDLSKIPDQNITFDVWIKNGALSEIKIDLAQLMTAANTGGGHLPLDAKFGNGGGAISAPSGATAIDIKSIIASLGAGL
jgi:hypothetical protein